MSIKVLPCCFFPTKVLFVDDHMTFLESLGLTLGLNNHTSIFFDVPEKALDFINQDFYQVSFMNRIVEREKSYSLDYNHLKISINKILQEIHYPDRNQAISVVVVDYNMPQVNGLMFCERLRNPHITKILLTGAADEHLAVNAFNQGIIDYYIPKGARNLAKDLTEAIYLAQNNYFIKSSEVITNSIKQIYEQDTAIDDKIYIRFFQDLLKKYQIKEYYLFEGTGSCLMINKDNELFNLFVKTKSLLEGLYWDVKDEEEFSEDLKEELKQNKKLLCFHMRDNHPIPPPAQWGKFLRPCQSFQGSKNEYYWTVTENLLDLSS